MGLSSSTAKAVPLPHRGRLEIACNFELNEVRQSPLEKARNCCNFELNEVRQSPLEKANLPAI